LVRLITVAAWLGVVTGIWVIIAAYVAGEQWYWVTPALAVVLVLASLICMIGPRKAFYAPAGLAFLLMVSTALGSARDLLEILTLGLGVVLLVVAVIAARREDRVSEQSHPMNLPVFG
jgi:uncharacterized membrane protein YjdF